MGFTGIKILVASHKPYAMPEEDIYLPILVGATGKSRISGWASDDLGDNISSKNQNYCELTALFWAWKNLSCDYLGLVHYRRHFRGRNGIVERTELSELLAASGVILPKKRNYFIETNRSQYVHAHHAEDLDLTRQILTERYPSYVAAFDRSMKSCSGHRFNMFVMRRDLADRYCEWLFDVLFELERRLDISRYSAYDARVFGFVSERLIDVWVETNGIAYDELPVLNLESQHWPRKIVGFLKRKFFGCRR